MNGRDGECVLGRCLASLAFSEEHGVLHILYAISYLHHADSGVAYLLAFYLRAPEIFESQQPRDPKTLPY